MSSASRFADRRHAGRFLAAELRQYAGQQDVIVLALPRGGVVVACEVASALRAPLDVLVVRKLGVPGHQELAMGAIASGGVRILNHEVVRARGIPVTTVEAVTAAEQEELVRRERLYRGNRPPLEVNGRIAILVDDGLATGSTMRAAVAALRTRGPKRLVIGAPIADPSTCEELAAEVDEIVCALTPEPLLAVGFWYTDFSQTSDDEVRALLEAAAREQAGLRKQTNHMEAS